MSQLTFTLFDKKTDSGIYYSTDKTNKGLTLYYLAAEVPSSDDDLDFSTIWSKQSGYYFFLPTDASITDATTLASAIKDALGDPVDNVIWIAWLNNPPLDNSDKASISTFFSFNFSGSGGDPKSTTETIADFLTINLNFPSGSNLNVDDQIDDPVFEIQTPTTGSSTITLNGTVNTLTIANDQSVGIPLTGDHIGVFSFASEWNRGDFYNLFTPSKTPAFTTPPSGEIRFQYNTSQPVNFRYPAFIGQDPSSESSELFFLNASLDVLNPLDGDRTRFAFDLEKFTPEISLPTANSLRNNSGSSLFMKPQTDPSDTTDVLKVAGFAIGNRPNENDDNSSVPYLVPIGNYGVDSSSETPTKAGVNKIMCGLVGTEFLLSADGDILEFTNLANSLATGFDPESKSNTNDVDDTYTTSWLRLIPGPNSETVFTGTIKESYCVQAPGSVYYSPGDDEGFSLATGVRLASLTNTDKTVPFPMVPYGSVYYSNSQFSNPNSETVASTLTSFEYDVLSPLRRQLIDPDLCNGPIFFDSSNGDPLAGGYVRSPIGLLVELNDGNSPPENTPAGTIKRLLLAKSPVNDTLLQFTAAPSPYCGKDESTPTVVSPKLSTALMHNSVFLVASNANLGNIGPFDNEIELGEFTYQVDLTGEIINPKAEEEDQVMTVMMFKFSTSQTAEQLASDTNNWTDAADFVGDDAAVTQVQNQIAQSIAKAKEEIDKGGDSAVYFQDFYTKMTDASWTGMIVLNCQLDYQSLPTDIQVLLGGIDGELIAHHFGVTVNQIKLQDDDPTSLDIDNSSLFSLIYYDKDYCNTDKTFQFQVTKLNVLYVNSVMTQFQSQIAMTIKELYGDSVSLEKGGQNDILDQDAIVIDGVYLKDGESGHIVFDSTTPRIFKFDVDGSGFRVLNNVVITDATLVPISSTTDSDNAEITIVKAAFQLNGEFGFNADVSTGDDKVDLFSYPINESTDESQQPTTLNFTNNALNWDTDIQEKEADIQYPIEPDLTNLKLDSSSTVPRDESLVATFPLNLTDFNWSPNGLAASSIGAKQVTGDDSLNVSLGEGNPPEFSLVFNLNMGNLGMLTSGTALQATVYLGWSSVGTSDVGGDNDMSLLFVPPTEFSSGDGGFKLQGVIETVYGELILNRLPVDDTSTSPLLFVLSLTNIQFSILSIALLPEVTGQKPRVLTLFGDPNKPQGSNLSWFLSNPNQKEAPVDIDIVYPQAGIMNGIKINSDFTGTQVISDAITGLEDVIYSSDTEVIQNIKQGVDTGTAFSYDPKAGILFFIDLQFEVLTFQMLMADPSFYGALLKLGDQEKGSFLEKWAGLEIELVYRKISEGLGVISVDFALPKAIRTIPNAEAPTNFTFPSFGLNVYTNGDWKIEVGWPFPSDNNAKIAFVLYGVPVFVGIGLYIAKLRGADVPGTFPESFKLIWMFGLGLSFGIEKEYPVKDDSKDGEDSNDSKGVISASFTLYIWASFQGMLVSKNGSITEDGVDYQWWTTTLGVNLNIQGEVDLKIISVALEVEASIYITLALETGHTTDVRVGADFKVKVTVKIVFIKIHITFKHHFDLAHWTWGSGPEALASGPTPCALDEYKDQPGCTDASAEDLVFTAAPMTAMAMAIEPETTIDVTQVSSASAKEETTETTPTPITLYYLLQPATATEDNGTTWNPYAISSLLIQMDPNNTGSSSDPTYKNTTTEFSTLLSVLANYIYSLLSDADKEKDLTSIINAMSTLVHDDDYFDESDTFLATDIVFTIDKGSNVNEENQGSFAIFPMFSQCKVTYNGTSTPLNAPTVPSDYVDAVQEYFDQYYATDPDQDSADVVIEVNEEISVDEMLVKDYFVMLAQQLVYELGNTLSTDTPPTTLADALLMVDNSNIAGFVSQFMLQGLRLPTFDGSTINIGNDDWQGIYKLAGLQTKLVKEDNAYITTFSLALADSTASDYIKFAGEDDPSSLDEDFPTDQILDAAPSTDWLTPPGGITILDPLAASQKTYNLQQPNTYTKGDDTRSLFPLPNAMQKDLEQFGSMNIDLSLISNSDSGTSQDSNAGTPVNGSPALFIAITINKVALPQSNSSGTYYENTYAINGTDEYTRELLDKLLTDFDQNSTLTLMIGTGGNEYVAPDSTENIILVKNNLSTDAEPESVQPNTKSADDDTDTSSLGPVQANLDDVEGFLRLIWEESVVKTAGYYLHLENIPDSSFTGESATIALLVGNGSAEVSSISLKAYHNLIDISEEIDKGALAAGVLDSSGNPIQVYQPNYAPGYTGFSVEWLNANPEPDVTNDPSEYITSLYRTIQFKIDSIEDATAPSDGYYWSKPNAAKSEPGTETDKDNWIFRQTIPAYQFINQQNPYDSIGKNVSLDIRILDMYGNALPVDSNNKQSTKIVYNDPLTTFGQLQWFKIVYYVDSSNGAPILDIDLDFDIDTVQSLIDAGGDSVTSQLQQGLAEYNTAIGQYTDPNTTLTIETSLSGDAFTKDGDNNGASIKDSFIDYLTSVAVYLQDILDGKTPTAPQSVIIRLDLDFEYIKSIEDTLFVVTSNAIITRKNTTTDITDLLPTVASVTNILAPYVTPNGGDDSETNTSSLAAFANQFELAYDGFDGADGQLKIGTGDDYSSGLENVQKNAVWAMKWSKSNGMAVSVTNDFSPSFYAPVPLATQLITRNEDVIQYTQTWDGSSSDIAQTIKVNFANIDMNVWASQFLNTFHDFVSPEMAGAIAKLDSSTYEDLMNYKNTIADAIASTIDLIIIPCDADSDPNCDSDHGCDSLPPPDSDFDSAKERMLQSLLTSLTNDYGTSALVQVPSDVSIVGQVEPNIDPEYPPTLFGKISANLSSSGEDDSDTPYTVSNAYLPLVDESADDKNQYLNFMLTAKHPEDQADLNLELYYDVGFINHQFQSTEEKYGYVPSSWITVVLPERLVPDNSTEPALLQIPLNDLEIPIPLRSFPASPSFNSQTAEGKKPTPTSIQELIEWTYTVQVSRPKAAQDELYLEVSYNENVDGSTSSGDLTSQANKSNERPAPEDLFEALARFSYEYPEIEPHLSTITDAAFEEKDVDVATAALSRMSELIDGVANTWGAWSNPAINRNSMRLADFTGDTANPGITPIDQTYKFRFTDEGKTITVTGVNYTSSDNSPLSDLPYPDITGYTKGTESDNQVIYTLASGDAPDTIELAFDELNIGTHQSAISRSYIERNADIAPDCYVTNKAFIFHTPVVSFKTPIVPLIDATEPITLDEEINLSTVISNFFNDFLGDDPSKSVVKELQFTLEVGAEFLMSSNTSDPANQTLVSKTPILFSQTAVATPSNDSGTPDTTLEDYECSLVNQILTWHDGISSDSGSATQMLYLSFTLFADVSESKLPLLRIRELQIEPNANDSSWWS